MEGDGQGGTLLGGEAQGAEQNQQQNQQPPAENAGGEGDKSKSKPAGPAYLPKEMQTNPVLSKYLQPTELAKAYLELHDRSQRSVVRPGENATDAEKAEWRKALGVPETLEGYEIPEKIGELPVDKNRMAGLAKIAFETGVSKEAFQRMVEQDAKAKVGELEALKRMGEKALSEATEKLKTEWGTEFEKNTAIAKRFYQSAFAPELAKAFRMAGMENNPEFVKAMVTLAKKSGAVDGEFVAGSGESSKKQRYLVGD